MVAFKVESKLSDVIQDDKFDAILCVAGGWAGGSAASSGEEHRLPWGSLLLSLIAYSLYACVCAS